MVSITSGVSLWYKPCYTIMLIYDNKNESQNLKQYKTRLSLIVEQMQTFALTTNLVMKVKNLFENVRQFA